MNSRTDFDDEHFFESYQAEKAAVDSAHELDEAEHQPPTPEQLAHRNRFRKPVAWAVVGLTLFSALALEEHGAQREYVAHLSAARPTPEPAAPAAIVPEDSPDTTTLLGEISIEADSPDSEASLDRSSAEFLSELTSMCWTKPDCGCALSGESGALSSAVPLAFDSCTAREQMPIFGRTFADHGTERTMAEIGVSKPVDSSSFDDFLRSIAATFDDQAH